MALKIIEVKIVKAQGIPKTHFKLDWETLKKYIEIRLAETRKVRNSESPKTSKSDLPKLGQSDLPKLGKSSITENTTENTTEKRERETPSKKEKEPYELLEYLLNIPLEDIKQFKEKYDVNTRDVKQKADGLYNWCLSNHKTKKDYKAFLRNALNKDFGLK